MPKRCGNAECNRLMNERLHNPIIVGDRKFCNQTCADTWMKQNGRFIDCADPMHVCERSRSRAIRLRLHGEGGFTGGRDYGDENDAQLTLPLETG